MDGTVTLCTDRMSFEQRWRMLLNADDVSVRVCHPAALAGEVAESTAVVFDGASSQFVDDDDELLSGVGFVRALDVVAATVAPIGERWDEVSDVLGDLCGGMVARGDERDAALVDLLRRSLERRHARRFELVGVSPREGEVLAILSNRRAVLVSRPLTVDDDLSEIETIELTDDDTAATLRLVSGRDLVLRAAEVRERVRHASTGNGTLPVHAGNGAMPMDGAHLGKRLRALRLEAGLTQAEVARRTGIHRPNIARVEGGRHTPSLDTLNRLAEAIGVPATRVFSDD